MRRVAVCNMPLFFIPPGGPAVPVYIIRQYLLSTTIYSSTANVNRFLCVWKPHTDDPLSRYATPCLQQLGNTCSANARADKFNRHQNRAVHLLELFEAIAIVVTNTRLLLWKLVRHSHGKQVRCSEQVGIVLKITMRVYMSASDLTAVY